jgi:hypothetical protein
MFFLCQLSRRYMVRESDWACAYGIWKTHLTDTWLTDCNYKWISSIISSGRIAIIFQKCLWDWIIKAELPRSQCPVRHSTFWSGKFNLLSCQSTHPPLNHDYLEISTWSAVSQLIHLSNMAFHLGLAIQPPPKRCNEWWRLLFDWWFTRRCH